VEVLIDSRQFRLVLSICDLFHWSDERSAPSLQKVWKQVVEQLGGDETDVAALYDLYFERTSIGQGDVHAFINDAQPEKCSGQLIPDSELSFSSATAGASPSLN
jgi:hypothetical protein